MKNKILLIFLLSLIIQSTLYSQWYQQSYPVSKPITGIEFTDSLKGWAVTSWGNEQDTCYILNTTNAGANWLIQFKMNGNSWDCIDMLNSMTGYVGGGPSYAIILKTTDGGQNWINIPNPISYFIEDIIFLNKDSGYVCNSMFRDVWRTSDGGLSWVMRNNGISSTGVRRLFFLDYNTGFCGASFTLFKTTNAGDNWVAVNGFSDFIYSIFFLDEITGWIGLANIKLSKTTNMGINWISQTLPDFFGSTVHDIKFINENTGWAGQFFITVLKTTNGGNIWGYQFDSSGSTTISIFDSSKGWSGFRGIESTFNGGGTITKINSYTNIIPTEFILFQNYPNPFNATTKITFEIKASSIVKLKIYDVSGREINKWESNGVLQSGRHEFLFGAGGMSSGVYFYKMEVTGQRGEKIYSESRKMMLVK